MPDRGNGKQGTGKDSDSLLPRPLRQLGPRQLTKQARVRAKQVVRKQIPTGARYAFRVDMTSMFLAGLYTGAVFPFVGVIARDDLKASPEIIAFLTAAPFLGNLLALFMARAMEGKAKGPFVMWSHLGARGMILLTAFAGGAWPFALVVSLCQLIGSLATPAYAAVIKDVYPDSQRGTILGYTRAAILVAQIGSTLAAGWIMGAIHLPGVRGYQLVFPCAAVVGIMAALIFSRINPNDVDDEVDPNEPRPSVVQKVRDTASFIWSTLAILREDQAFRWFAFSVFTYGFGNLLTVPIVTVIQVDELHITKTQLAVMFNLMQLIMIACYFYWGRFVDRKSPQQAVVINVLFNCLVPVVYISTAFIPGVNAWWLLPAYVVSGIVNAGIDLSYFNAILTFAGPDNVSRYQALQSFLLGIRGSIAPFIGGALVPVFRAHDINLRWAFVVGLIFMLTGAWMQSIAMRRQAARQLLLDQG